MAKPILIGSRLDEAAMARIRAARDAEVPIVVIAKRFDLSPCWIRKLLVAMTGSSSNMCDELKAS